MFALPGDRAVVSALSAGRPRSAAMGRSPDRSALADAQSLTWPARVRVSPTHPTNQPDSQPAGQSADGGRRTPRPHPAAADTSAGVGAPPPLPRAAPVTPASPSVCAEPRREGRGGEAGSATGRPQPAPHSRLLIRDQSHGRAPDRGRPESEPVNSAPNRAAAAVAAASRLSPGWPTENGRAPGA